MSDELRAQAALVVLLHGEEHDWPWEDVAEVIQMLGLECVGKEAS